MKKAKLLTLLPIFALTACGGGVGSPISEEQGYQRAMEIENSNALLYVRCVKATMTESYSRNGVSESESYTININQNGDFYLKEEDKGSAAGISASRTVEVYRVSNIGGFDEVVYLKVSQNMYGTTSNEIHAYVDGYYDSEIQDYYMVREALDDGALELAEDFYYSPSHAMENFYRDGCAYSFYSKGPGNLTMKVQSRSSSGGFGNNANYEYYYDDDDYKSYSASVTYDNYLMVSGNAQYTTYDGTTSKLSLSVSYPQSVSITLPSNWRNYLGR